MEALWEQPRRPPVQKRCAGEWEREVEKDRKEKVRVTRKGQENDGEEERGKECELLEVDVLVENDRTP